MSTKYYHKYFIIINVHYIIMYSKLYFNSLYNKKYSFYAFIKKYVLVYEFLARLYNTYISTPRYNLYQY